MLIAEDSPLRQVPASVDARQKLLLEGIRYAAEMAAVGFARLEAVALAYSREALGCAHDREQLGHANAFTLLLTDAWTVVDAVRRLRRFLEQLQRTADNEALTRFRKETQGVWDLRDTFQHLERRISLLVAHSQPLMGTLTWVYVSETDPADRHVLLAVPGEVRVGSSIGMNAAAMAQTADKPVDQFVLSAWEPSHGQAARTTGTAPLVQPDARVIAVSLTDTVRRVEEVVRELERVLAPQFAGHEVGATDLFLAMALRLGDEGDAVTVTRVSGRQESAAPSTTAHGAEGDAAERT